MFLSIYCNRDGSEFIRQVAPMESLDLRAMVRKWAEKVATQNSYKSATRTIQDFSFGYGFPMVEYDGWNFFIVRPSEVLEINGEPV